MNSPKLHQDFYIKKCVQKVFCHGKEENNFAIDFNKSYLKILSNYSVVNMATTVNHRKIIFGLYVILILLCIVSLCLTCLLSIVHTYKYAIFVYNELVSKSYCKSTELLFSSLQSISALLNPFRVSEPA